MLGAPSVYRQILKQFKLNLLRRLWRVHSPGAGVVWEPNSKVNRFDPKFMFSELHRQRGKNSEP